MLGVVRYLVTAAGIRLPGAISLDGTQFFHIGYGWEGSQAVPVAGALHVLAFVSFPYNPLLSTHKSHIQKNQ
jgi:hypothetical protein